MSAPAIIDAVIAGVVGHGGLAQGLSGLKSLVWLIPYLLCALVYLLSVAVGLAALIVQVLHLRNPAVRSARFYLRYGRFLFIFSLVMGLVGAALLLIVLIADGIPDLAILWKALLFLFLPYVIGGFMARLMVWLARMGKHVTRSEGKPQS